MDSPLVVPWLGDVYALYVDHLFLLPTLLYVLYYLRHVLLLHLFHHHLLLYLFFLLWLGHSLGLKHEIGEPPLVAPLLQVLLQLVHLSHDLDHTVSHLLFIEVESLDPQIEVIIG